MEFKYDSADDAPIDENNFMATYASNTYGMLLDVKMIAHVNSRGVVETVQLDPDVQKLKQGFQAFRPLQATAVLLEPAGLNSIFFGGLIPVPEEAISIGDSWSETFTSPAESAFGTFKMEFSPHYVGSVEIDGQSLERFDVDVGMAFDKPLTTLLKLGKQKTNGILYFDQQANAVHRCEWTVDSELIFNDGEAKGRMILGVKAKFGPKEASDGPKAKTK
jgi:hypothetical protein